MKSVIGIMLVAAFALAMTATSAAPQTTVNYSYISQSNTANFSQSNRSSQVSASPSQQQTTPISPLSINPLAAVAVPNFISYRDRSRTATANDDFEQDIIGGTIDDDFWSHAAAAFSTGDPEVLATVDLPCVADMKRASRGIEHLAYKKFRL